MEGPLRSKNGINFEKRMEGRVEVWMDGKMEGRLYYYLDGKWEVRGKEKIERKDRKEGWKEREGGKDGRKGWKGTLRAEVPFRLSMFTQSFTFTFAKRLFVLAFTLLFVVVRKKPLPGLGTFPFEHASSSRH